jgi:hypothetical protein
VVFLTDEYLEEVPDRIGEFHRWTAVQEVSICHTVSFESTFKGLGKVAISVQNDQSRKLSRCS